MIISQKGETRMGPFLRKVLMLLVALVIFVSGIGFASVGYVVKTHPAFANFRAAVHRIIDQQGCPATITVQYLEQSQKFHYLETFSTKVVMETKGNGKQHWIYADYSAVQQKLWDLSDPIAHQLYNSGVMQYTPDMVYDSYEPWNYPQQKALSCPIGGFQGSIVIIPDDIQRDVNWGEWDNFVSWRPERIQIDELNTTPGKWYTIANWGDVDANKIVGTFAVTPGTDTSLYALTYLQQNGYCKATTIADPNHGFLVVCPKK